MKPFQRSMKKTASGSLPESGSDSRKLPRLLKYYRDSDFATQQKARFIYYLCLYAMLFIVLIIFTTIYIHLHDIEHNGIYLPAILPLVGALVLFFVCLLFLFRGYYGLSAHLGIASGMFSVWLIMWIDTSSTIARIDTVVILVALMNLAPLFITKYKSAIGVYIVLNISILIVFMASFRQQMGLPQAVIIDYIVDSGLAMIFTGIVGYSIYEINHRVLNKALEEITIRKQTEKALAGSEKKIRELNDLLPQTLFEADIHGKITYVNKNGLIMFGYDEQDLRNGINLYSLISSDYHETARTNLQSLIKGQSIHGTRYSAIKKDGSSFTIQGYTALIEEDSKPVGIRGIIVDITENRKAMEALKLSRDQFQSLVANIPGITYRCQNDEEGTMLYVSSEIHRLCGYNSSDFIQNKVRSYKSLIYPEDRKRVCEAVHKGIGEGEPWEAEYRISHRDGRVRWVYEKGRAIFDPAGELMFLDGFILDISERKITEEALRESESMMGELLNGIPLPAFMLDSNLAFLYLNEAFAGDYGREAKELLGRDYLALLQPELAAQRKHIIEKVFLEGKPVFFDESNQDNYYTNYIYPILDAGSRVKYVVIFALDITKWKQSEKKLKESEERYRKLVEAFPDIIMLTDLNGNILYGNAPLERIMGISPKDYSNPQRAAHIHPDDLSMLADAINDLILNDKPHTEILENRFFDAWGNLHWVSGRVAKVNINGNIVLQTVSRDITDKKLTEKELENHRNNLELIVTERTEELATTNEELTATNEELFNQREELQTAIDRLNDAQRQLIQSEKMASLGLLSAGIAHEINNPLNFIHGGILGIEDYIKDYLPEHMEMVSPLIHAIHEGVKRSSEIVSSLNHYSRQDDLPQADCDVHAIIDNCLVMLNSQLKNRIEVTKNYAGPCLTFGNEGKLHQALLNVLANAVQSMEAEGTIVIHSRKAGGSIHISIRDSGCGISPENLEKIFDPFFTTKAPGKGTGLGLSITYRIIREHNGTIEYESQPGKGTTATIRLPAKGIGMA
jgi:PAS domain S-box-containing protein